MDNNKNEIKGHVMLVVQFGIRNFYYGVFHYFIRYLEYRIGMGILIGSELIFVILLCCAIKKRVYKSDIKILVFVVQNFIKMLMFLTLFADYENLNNQMIEEIQFYLIMISIFVFLLGFAYELSQSVLDLKDLLIFIFQYNKV